MEGYMEGYPWYFCTLVFQYSLDVLHLEVGDSSRQKPIPVILIPKTKKSSMDLGTQLLYQR